MQITFCNRWLLVLLLLASTCTLVSYAKGGGGRGGGGRGGGGSRGSYSRPSYSRPSYSRPAPAPAYRPAPAPAYRPAPAPAYRPAPAPAPAYRPAPAVYVPKPAPAVSKPSEPVVVRQPAYNPSFGSQPAYNPNYKPGVPAGPPPPYSPAGHPQPNAPVGPPPPYRPNQPSGSLGNPPPGVQPPPYPGQPGVRPPAYPGQPAPYPVQPGYPGSYPSPPGVNRPYPVQPGYPSQPGVNRPYPVQPGYPGSFHQQPGMNRPYPVQPGINYPPGGNRPYPQQPLGGNVWQPHHSQPAPAYMNYGGIPTGTNMYTKPHKKKGFIGSLMSAGKQKPVKPNKYYGSYPSPYAAGGMGNMGGGGFLGKHGKSAAMYTIFPYMAAKSAPKFKIKPRFGYMPMYMHQPYYHQPYYYHHHHYHRHGYDDDDWEHAAYFDVYNDDYVGKCQKPIKKENSEIKCKSTSDETQCDARCEKGYRFPGNIEIVSNKCWHVTGVWRPQKNFPGCEPACENECMNGGKCIRPAVCKCPSEFRGSRCQFHILECDIQKLVKGENVGWVCNHFKNETICKIKCKEPTQFESPSAEAYKCSADGTWKPDTIPQCVTKEKRDLESIFLEK